MAKRHSEIRSASRSSDNVRISLQTLDALQLAKHLAGIAADMKSQNFCKSRKVTGMIHVLNELLAGDDSHSGKTKGVLLFDDAYDLYSSAFEAEMSVPDRINIRDELLSSEIGLPVSVHLEKCELYCTQPRKVGTL